MTSAPPAADITGPFLHICSGSCSSESGLVLGFLFLVTVKSQQLPFVAPSGLPLLLLASFKRRNDAVQLLPQNLCFYYLGVYYLFIKRLLNHLQCCCMFVLHRSGGKRRCKQIKAPGQQSRQDFITAAGTPVMCSFDCSN